MDTKKNDKQIINEVYQKLEEIETICEESKND